MARAEFRLEFPSNMWVSVLTRQHPELTIRVLAATPTQDGGVAVAEVTGPESEAFTDQMRAQSAITDLDVLTHRPESQLIQFEANTPLILVAAGEAGVPISFPLTIQDGAATWQVTASHDRLSSFAAELDAKGFTFTVEAIYQEIDSDSLLTDDQWEMLRTAAELGYYDVPRTCTQYELAEELGIARSTCSEILHRAESRLITHLLAEGPDTV